MKKLVFGLVATVALAATSLAGTATYSSGKGYKEVKNVVTPTCFSDTELQVDAFGSFAVGERGEVGAFKDHAWGGGIGVNYFFARYFGIGVDGELLTGKEDPTLVAPEKGSDSHLIGGANGNVIFRYPFDSICLAPYVFVGGGGYFERKEWGSGDVGGGLEYRILPNKLGIFADGRWNYLGDRFSRGDLNFTLVRAGVRWVF